MMEKDKLESLLIDYIDDHLDDDNRKVVEEILRENKNAQKLYEQLSVVMQAMNGVNELQPSGKVSSQFHTILQSEIDHQNKGKVISIVPWYYRVAAAVALIVIGSGIGYWISHEQNNQDDLEAMKRELEMTKQLVMSRLNNDQSASQRILGVQAAYEVKETDHEIVDALIRVMNEDKNSNVRLSAIEALSKFRDESKVRAALIASLSIQTDPGVQIALIQLMVQMKEKGAVESLQQMIKEDKVLPAVKDEAYAGIFKLT